MRQVQTCYVYIYTTRISYTIVYSENCAFMDVIDLIDFTENGFDTSTIFFTLVT